MRDTGIVTSPMSLTRKKEVVADPAAFVEDAMSKSGSVEPNAPWRVSFPYAVVVPSASDFVVLLKKKVLASPENPPVPFANCMVPATPEDS